MALLLLLVTTQAAAQLTVCNTDQHVVAHECVDCPPGSTNRGGDDPTGPNSACDGVNVCSSHEYASMVETESGSKQLACKECPVGTAVQAPGDDLVQVALGFSVPCQGFSCTRPEVQTGYDLTFVQETLDATTFSATGIVCAAGYAGTTATAVSCAETDPHRVGPYSLTGCEQCVAGSTYAPTAGLRQCLACHVCHHRNEIELTHCTATTDRTCACAANFTGTPSSGTSPMSGCRPVVHNDDEPVTQESSRSPVDAYNLGTLSAHCQMWAQSNRETIAIINQHLARTSAEPEIPGYGTCQDYCAHFYSRREATVCHGLCDIVGLPAFLSGLADVTVGPFEMCKAVFRDVRNVTTNSTNSTPSVPEPDPAPEPEPAVCCSQSSWNAECFTQDSQDNLNKRCAGNDYLTCEGPCQNDGDPHLDGCYECCVHTHQEAWNCSLPAEAEVEDNDPANPTRHVKLANALSPDIW